MRVLNKFRVTEIDGKRFANRSGDLNNIHLDDIIGYNSIYGEKICHGCNILIKTLDLIYKKEKNITKFNHINVKFIKYFKYKKNIFVIKKDNKYIISQEKINKSKLFIEKKDLLISKELNLKKFKFYKLSKIKKVNNKLKLLKKLIEYVSYYVGMINPGKNSIINSIKINYFVKEIKYKNGIYSRFKKSGYPIIENYLIYKNFFVEFETTVRPHLIKKKIKPNRNITNHIQKLRKNILILGASDGLGKETLNLYKRNKNIKIFATYYKNKIEKKFKNILVLKINIIKDAKKIINLVISNNIQFIYYFCSPKILNKPNKSQIRTYHKIFEIVPSFLVKELSKREKINFFYPSTIFINKKNRYENDIYSKIKLHSENKLLKVKSENKNFNLYMPRLPRINTKQNLNILNIKYPSLIEVLNKDVKMQKLFLFRK